MTWQKQRYVEGQSDSLFFRRLNATPEWRISPADTPEQVIAKSLAERAYLVRLLEGINTPAFKQIEEMLEGHVRVIDGEKIWEAILSKNEIEEQRLTIERMGIVMFFQMFAGLEEMIKGIDAQLATLGATADPELHSPTGTADPALE